MAISQYHNPSATSYSYSLAQLHTKGLTQCYLSDSSSRLISKPYQRSKLLFRIGSGNLVLPAALCASPAIRYWRNSLCAIRAKEAFCCRFLLWIFGLLHSCILRKLLRFRFCSSCCRKLCFSGRFLSTRMLQSMVLFVIFLILFINENTFLELSGNIIDCVIYNVIRSGV